MTEYFPSLPARSNRRPFSRPDLRPLAEPDMMHDGWMNWGQSSWGGTWSGPLILAGVLFIGAALIFAVIRSRNG